MGMSASQARLLSVTARLHDLEYQAQSIQAAKVQLSTQSDQAYEDYLEALDATTLTLKTIDTLTGTKSTVIATFNNLCSRNRLTAADGNRYALRNANGLLLVEEDIAREFNSGTHQDAYEFALYMMNEETGDLQSLIIPGKQDLASVANDAEENVYQSLSGTEKGELKTLHEKLEGFIGGNSTSKDIYDYSNVDIENREEYEETLNQYKELLYSKYSGEINERMYTDNGKTAPVTSDEFDDSLFNYYVGIYNQIKLCGGCESITKYGESAGNDSEWLSSMVESGQISISLVKNDDKASKMKLTATSPSSDISLASTEASSIDSRALKVAEAEYNNKLKLIDRKDKQFDLDLSKLETERSALTTEIDSIKKVIEDNVKRTFGIFS